ncbi:secernin-2-like [Oppia nitens]|uniref:secernin-2-like n=1 Tax=Oppia nitens TaxID=1686743 RepID=UPI0023DA0602|nr:secernin-2-like [Oppia nitens]
MAKSCDTFVVLPPLTANNLTIFGKNSDRPNGEVQEIVYYPRKTYENECKQECTYISVDSVQQTYAVILSKPSWMWGSEMGANEYGVCVGNEAIWTQLNGPNDEVERLLGMDLVRLALERAKTSCEALEVITTLLEKHGQGGTCSESSSFTYHNSFLIVDPNDAYVLETADREWAAEKIESGFRNISNCLSIGTKIDLMSKGLKQVAIVKGLWDGVQEFNFSKVYGTGSADTPLDNQRFIAGRQLLQNYSKDNLFDINSMIAILRDEPSGICRPYEAAFPSTSSQVSVLSKSESRPSCHWFTGTPDPKHSVFKPFIFCDGFEITSNIVSPVIPDDPVRTIPRFQRQVDRRHTLYKVHQNFYQKLIQNNSEGNDLRQTLNRLEKDCIEEVDKMLQNYDSNDQTINIKDLFNDCVESELRFYK